MQNKIFTFKFFEFESDETNFAVRKPTFKINLLLNSLPYICIQGYGIVRDENVRLDYDDRGDGAITLREINVTALRVHTYLLIQHYNNMHMLYFYRRARRR